MSNNKKIRWYSVSDSGDENRFALQTAFSQLSDIAEDAAEDYHSNHDGWESRWPLVFTLYESEEGPSIGRFEIDRESVPEFHARELSPSVAADAERHSA